MNNTESKFKPEEIIGFLNIEGRRVTYLKPRIKRLHRYPETEIEDEITQLNQPLIGLQKYAKYLKEVVGLDDFEDK